MKTLTPDEREQLKADLDTNAAAVKPLRDWAEPILKTLQVFADLRAEILERYGLAEEPRTCEGCECFILPGDMIAHYEDGPDMCEACAPTYEDVLAQKKETLEKDSADLLDETVAELKQDIAALEARSPEARQAKCVVVYEP